MTETYAKLPVSAATYAEIRQLLEKAGYDHAFLRNGAIDMRGIGLVNAEDYHEDTTQLLAQVAAEYREAYESGSSSQSITAEKRLLMCARGEEL